MGFKVINTSISHALIAALSCVYTGKLWMAPELIDCVSPTVTAYQKGDVYSFAIICQEVIYRNGVFYLEDNSDISPEGQCLVYRFVLGIR